MARKLARVLGWTLISLVAIALAGAGGLVLWARSAAGRRALLGRVLPGIQARLDGELRIGAVDGDLTRFLLLRDVELRDADGEVALRIGCVSVSYDLLGLVRHRLVVDDLIVERAVVYGHSLRDGRFNLASLVKPAT